MTVSLSLGVIGTDEEPRWIADIRPGSGFARHSTHCCKDGHFTPEAAAAHGAERAASLLVSYVRTLQPPACGALAIQRLEAA